MASKEEILNHEYAIMKEEQYKQELQKRKEIKNILKELAKNGIYYKVTFYGNEGIIHLGYKNAPENYQKYNESEKEQLLYLLRNYKLTIKEKTEYGYKKEEIRINLV
jgi:hypothetical protein